MGLGKRKDAVNYTPLVKFDARNGQMTRCDRVQENGDWVTKAVDITEDLRGGPRPAQRRNRLGRLYVGQRAGLPHVPARHRYR